MSILRRPATQPSGLRWGFEMASNQILWGILGNATIARVCVIPAIQKSRNGRVYAIGTRSPQNAGPVVTQNRIQHVYDDYDALLADPAIHAVYIPLPNHLHYPWTLKALKANQDISLSKSKGDLATLTPKNALVVGYVPR